VLVHRKKKKFLALIASLICLMFSCVSSQVQIKPGNGMNIILMIGDGMGWQMTRAAAIASGATPYNSGKGAGLNFQKLSGYTFATTYGTILPDNEGKFSTRDSALDGSNPITGKSPITKGFTFNPAIYKENTSPGNIVGYDVALGGSNPWTPGSDKEYIKQNIPDSANTATSLYTGVKTYNSALGVDIYEQRQTTIIEQAALNSKSTGLVTSVPINHATPAAAASFVNKRDKFNAPNPDKDNILQQMLTIFKPTVILGGGHPLDLRNKSITPGQYDWEYIDKLTYYELKTKPTSNIYGYTFLERGKKAASALLDAAKKIDPNKGERLLGIYGARGQNGNLPYATANGDYSGTGFHNASLFFKASKEVALDKQRPLDSGEDDAKFIAREKDENPTLAQLTQAALTTLSQDPDGFWLMVEGGDIDWASHDDNLDNMIGAVQSFDKAVATVVDWISKNGGWQKNLLIVTADHDHYLTLNPDFPDLLKRFGAEDLTYNKNNPKEAGYFWGSDSTVQFGWGTHSNHLVPVYYQGGPVSLEKYIGKEVSYIDSPPGGSKKTYKLPGVLNAVDQTHIYQMMLETIQAPIGSN
jgi:alkaline phosphatase